MRKEQTDLFPNNYKQTNIYEADPPQEEIHFQGLTFYQPLDPMGILMEEMNLKNRPFLSRSKLK